MAPCLQTSFNIFNRSATLASYKLEKYVILSISLSEKKTIQVTQMFFTEHNRTEPNRTEQSRTEHNKINKNSTCTYSNTKLNIKHMPNNNKLCSF